MKSWWLAALPLLALAAASLRLWDCPLCSRPPAPAGCPSCRDLGRASTLTRLLRPRPDPLVRALLAADSTDAVSAALQELLDREGLRAATSDVLYEARVLFVVHAGEPAVLALTRQVSYRSPGRQRAEAWIFNPRGERVDHLLAVASTIGGGVGWDVGGGRLRLVGGPGGCEVWPDGGPPETVPYQGSNLLATFPLGGRELRREP